MAQTLIRKGEVFFFPHVQLEKLWFIHKKLANVASLTSYLLPLFFLSEHKDQATRSLRGVMRVGLVAKGLLLKGDLDLELVLLCKDKPTISLLKKVSENLVTQLKVRHRAQSVIWAK